VGPYAVGLLKDTTGGMTGSFLVLAALALCAGVLVLLLRRQKSFARRGQPAAAILAGALAPETS
jgi:cyanate permease